MAFHVEQRQAGNEIIDKFTREQPFTVLLAQMQSGKTGTYLFTGLEMVRLGLVKNVAIICGSSDTSLRAQARDDLLSAFKSFQRETMVGGDMEGAIRLTDATIGVHFSQDLHKLGEISNETLVIHDESHMAQSKNNIPFKLFYQKNNLDKALMGDFSELKEKHCYILGVSATPFSEIVANKKVQTEEWTSEESAFLNGVELSAKNFYFMQPGSGYIGVTELLKKDSIKFEAENIKSYDCSHVATILRKGSPKYHQKYLVIRTMCAEKDMDMMQTIASSTGCDYVSVFGGQGSLEFMKVKPTKTTLVHICGKFRMGQVVPKQHIAMVYEQSKHPNADTILQGLLGRMCGYRSNGAHTDVEIYVSQTAEELVRKYSKAWEDGVMDELSTVTRAMNLGGVKRKNGGMIVQDKDGIQHIATVPISFPVSFIDKDFGDKTASLNQISATDILDMFDVHPEVIEGNPDEQEIKKILRKVRPEGKRANWAPYHRNKSFKNTASFEESKKQYSMLKDAIGQSRRLNTSSHAQNCRMRSTSFFELTPLTLYGSEKKRGNENGTCYLMGYIRYDPEIHGLISEELASVDPKCNYIPGIVQMEDDSELDDVNGGQIIPFSIDTADDPSSLETELEKAILRTIEGEPSYIEGATRAIHSLFDKETRLYEGIRLDKEIYTEELINTIKENLDRKYSVSIAFKKSRGRQPKDQIKYASISW